MPPQPPTTFRIEDLKARLKLEPKSRLFYPLAEELRKLQRHADAEKVLRNGLTVHAGYISAWISLGRVLFELEKYREAVETLQKACTLDPGNVVAARLLADAHYALGEKVEAIKKYKLVRALLPVDEEINHTIARLEVELTKIATEEPAPAKPAAVAAPPAAPSEPAPTTERLQETEPLKAIEPSVPLTPAIVGEGAVKAVDVDAAIRGGRFTDATPKEADQVAASGRESALVPDESREFPLEDLGPSTDAPPANESTVPPPEQFSAAPIAPGSQDDFDETHPLKQEEPFSKVNPPKDPLSTATMADLYARQGHTDNAREIYSKLLQTSPENPGVREKLDSLTGESEQPPKPNPPTGVKAEDGPKRQKVDRLEKWLSHVARK